MIQQYLKKVIISLLLIAAARMNGMQTTYPLKTGTLGMGPLGSFYQQAPIRSASTPTESPSLAAKIKAEKKDLDNLCKFCQIRYLQDHIHNRNSSYASFSCPTETCRVAAIIAAIVDQLHPRLGLDYWHIKYKIWQISTGIIQDPTAIGLRSLSYFHELIEKLNSIRSDIDNGTYEKMNDFLQFLRGYRY